MNAQTLTALLAAALVLGACERRTDNSTAPANPPSSAADNTARNRADRDSSAQTPLSQSNSSQDTRITADIRKAVMAESALSTNAHNCKIITDHGAVTLRGVVDSQSEKDAIESKAKDVAGVVSVSNELEVKTK